MGDSVGACGKRQFFISFENLRPSKSRANKIFKALLHDFTESKILCLKVIMVEFPVEFLGIFSK